VSLREALATPASKAAHVRRLFATIADRYDLITRVLSYGQDSRWKKRLIGLASVRRGERALDVACGTGDLTFLLRNAGADVAGLDITLRMVQIARGKAGIGSPCAFLVGDMGALPFGDQTFEIVTTGYGLRNVPDLTQALGEIRRVLKPGGRLLSLDFNRPASTPVRAVYLAYLTLVGSALGWLLHRDPDTYRYIPESIKRYPGARGVVDLLRAEGFRSADWYPVLGGLMGIHVAERGP
jgi:ubiquinone/menaquinone biosynthesis methyltransferase